ncbi:MAG: LysR family transcriptional regulator [Archangium sp.]|nr:LysR family transcriptional regulator [Archangium sp.]
MNTLHQVDLNLWVVLGHLLETSSVSDTARRLGRTQSAVSHSLAALRETFSDPLFVRVGAKLEPTTRAKQLEPTVRSALEHLQSTLKPTETFEPARLRRTFRMFLSDYGQMVLLGPLLRRLERVAPHVVLDVTFKADAGPDLARDVQAGRCDLSVGPPLESLSGVLTQPLFDDTNVCVVRAGHPFAKQPTAKAWAKLRHVVASPRGALRDFVDEALEQKGLSRTVVARVPHFMAALELVAQTDAVTVVPARLARVWASRHVRLIDPPLPLPAFTMSWFVSEVARTDPANMWLRSELKRVVPASATRR